MEKAIKKEKGLKAGIIASYAAILLNIAAGFFLTSPIISSVGAANYGIYSAANSLLLSEIYVSIALRSLVSTKRSSLSSAILKAIESMSL